MAIPTLALALALAAAAAAVVVVVVVVRRRLANRRKVLAQADSVIADLLNASNAEVRSLELGFWFLDRLRAEVRSPGKSSACSPGNAVDYAAIASRVPGTNEVARAEHVKHLKALMVLACRLGDPAASLDAFRAHALLAGGTLTAAPYAYVSTSRAPLP